MEPLILSKFTLTSAVGCGLKEHEQALLSLRSGLGFCDLDFINLDTYIGRVKRIEDSPMVARLKEFDCRNNRLAQLTLQQDGFEQAVEEAKIRYGPERIGLFLGTSTSGMLQTEMAYRHRDPVTGDLPKTFNYKETQNNFSVAAFVKKYLKLEGPALVISTACSSSAKVFAEASRFIESGFCDAAIVGGVDSLCQTTLHGFSSLELVSTKPCRPADSNRDGLSIGEAGGYTLLEKPENSDFKNQITFLGYGESSDAYHMTSPHPDGRGMAQSMQMALECSGLKANQISYINLHGTATHINDKAEDKAVVKIFGSSTPCSSTKGWTGHTLGAAGIAEAIICAICLNNNFIPGSLNTRVLDSDFGSNIILANRNEAPTYVLSNSFGFGGNNCSLIFGIHS
ncbi:MAG: beta-ketoacyl-[acyl-carrier-protein] synthase family protein [Nitrospina sp.]|nr:beta-ketoacyl-[acyl-carrier-protein] synthase family protein [Nitrospina sp.]